MLTVVGLLNISYRQTYVWTFEDGVVAFLFLWETSVLCLSGLVLCLQHVSLLLLFASGRMSILTGSSLLVPVLFYRHLFEYLPVIQPLFLLFNIDGS